VQVTTTDIDQLTGNWGLGAALAPTSVSISGSVTTSTGQPIRNATVTISGGGLPAPITTFTGNFGTYIFSGLQPNQTYLVQVSAKRYRFTLISQLVLADHDVANVNFTANPQE
jgi:protocatechuate 3,4-dioxygenase beta subunit